MTKTPVLKAIAAVAVVAFISLAAGGAFDAKSAPKSKKSDPAAKSKADAPANEASGSDADEGQKRKEQKPGELETATFGTGCFWCSEAIFQRLKGVESVVPGYSGGHVKNPSYQQVCTKTTGHAEVVQITYDPTVISFKELLEVFWKSHDPTSLNKQGHDSGPQYRSVIFYHNDDQKDLAERAKKELDKEKVFSRKIVTEISAFKEFYQAEDYHLNYFNNNPGEYYCQSIIGPKVNKIKRVFKDKLK